MVMLLTTGIVSLSLMLSVVIVVYTSPVTLELERVIPTNHKIKLDEIETRDRVRHSILLSGVVSFPVQGDLSFIGLYYTNIKLGTPPIEFSMLIDTGSYVSWVSCKPCYGCPISGELETKPNFFDPWTSSTASYISCTDKRCRRASKPTCSIQNNMCSYEVNYEDGSITTGFYVSDVMYFRNMTGTTWITDITTPIIFGCSNIRKDQGSSGIRIDGVLGFGSQRISIISQLASQGPPRVFSHCLKGSGGGKLVIGEVVDPKIIYTPLVPSKPHYNVVLQSISFNGQTIAIDPSVGQKTIIDSGTTLAYLARSVYDPLMNFITNANLEYARPVISDDYQCYIMTSRADVNAVFPPLSFNFASETSMVVYPQDYLHPSISTAGTPLWCISFLRTESDEAMTILGDLVLKDKIFVYDLDRKQIEWTDYNCSLPVNVSSKTGNKRGDYSNVGWNVSRHLLPRSLIAIFLYIAFTFL